MTGPVNLPDDADDADDTGSDDTGGEGTPGSTGGTGDSGNTSGTDSTGNDSQLGGAGERALERIKESRNKARRELKEARDKLQEYEDRDKSESERLNDTANRSKERADKAEADSRRMRVAMERAPEGATLDHVRAVAKRASGESDEDLESDADELFSMIVPPKPASQDDSGDEGKKSTTPQRKPREVLKGGGEPQDEPEETDPAKLAAQVERF